MKNLNPSFHDEFIFPAYHEKYEEMAIPIILEART